MQCHYTAAIVGFGNSGQRFATLCDEVKIDGAQLLVTCIVDVRNEHEFSGLSKGTRFTNSIRTAFEMCSYDVIFICTNDNTHFDVLLTISQYMDRFRIIVCEKPLTSTLSQAEVIKRIYGDKSIILNFNERLSEPVRALRRFMGDNDLMITRAAFFWGKNRIHDPRPTMGVFSEMAHPIDLAGYVADLGAVYDFKLLNATSIRSLYSRSDHPVPDSVEMTIAFPNGVILSGSGSYLWDNRDRRVIFYLGKELQCARYVAALRFDHPRWDDDSMEIWDLGMQPGCMTKIEKPIHLSERIETRLVGVDKMYRLVGCLIRELQGKRSSELARLDDAIFVQRVLDAIENQPGFAHHWPGRYAGRPWSPDRLEPSTKAEVDYAFHSEASIASSPD